MPFGNCRDLLSSRASAPTNVDPRSCSLVLVLTAVTLGCAPAAPIPPVADGASSGEEEDGTGGRRRRPRGSGGEETSDAMLTVGGDASASAGGTGPGPTSTTSVTEATDGGSGDMTTGAPTGLDPFDRSVENPGADCPVPSTDFDGTAFGALAESTTFPDPFTMLDGTPVTTQSQWVCRRAEISALFQKWQLGPKPEKPASVTGTATGNSIAVTVSDGAGANLNFTANITYPTGQGPFPAVIGLAGGSIPPQTFLNLGVAVINFNHNAMGSQGGQATRGQGQFFDFNGDVDAGALLAWSWGVSRLIDALEVTPDANIDPQHLAVTGCSRDGKGALTIGALDARIALTIPQESGAGGAASWRVSQVEDDALAAQGVPAAPNDNNQRRQTLQSAAGEQPWFRENFFFFGGFVNRLPVDHHEMLGLVAPRGLFVIANSAINWLGVNSGDQSAGAGRLIYESLGVPENFGQVESGHAHCSEFPEVAQLQPFIRKFLLEEDVEANTFVTANAFDRAEWVDWEAPVLTP